MTALARLSVALTLATPLGAQALIRVPADAPTIQAGIALAVDGDTVRVAPGTYPEFIDYLGKAIVVESEGGANVTLIDATGLFESVVSFHAGEGPGSVLRGFTVTGGLYTGFQAGGISGFSEFGVVASPRIESCIVRGNRTFNGFAGGITGNATIEDCLVEGNSSSYAAGGIAGAPIVRRCTIQDNHGYDGGGLYLFGGRVEDTLIRRNSATEGTKGGGVFVTSASVVLLRCQIVDNTAAANGFYVVSSAGIFAYTPGGAALVVNCTVANNRFFRPDPPSFDDCGGVGGSFRIVNTIVRGNDGAQLYLGTGSLAIFSDIEGGFPGDGNFDADPLFVDAAAGDYGLRPGSPCIDTGALRVPLDPDCTRSDVGARYFAQPCVQTRNGSGVNPVILTSLAPPRLGTTWTGRVDASAIPGAFLSALEVRTALDAGTPTPWGELLIGGTTLFAAARASTGTFDDFAFAIPADPALIAFEAHVQAAVRAPGASTLTNALLLRLGQ